MPFKKEAQAKSNILLLSRGSDFSKAKLQQLTFSSIQPRVSNQTFEVYHLDNCYTNYLCWWIQFI